MGRQAAPALLPAQMEQALKKATFSHLTKKGAEKNRHEIRTICDRLRPAIDGLRSDLILPGETRLVKSHAQNGRGVYAGSNTDWSRTTVKSSFRQLYLRQDQYQHHEQHHAHQH